VHHRVAECADSGELLKGYATVQYRAMVFLMVGAMITHGRFINSSSLC
jgi:hypothetical protein